MTPGNESTTPTPAPVAEAAPAPVPDPPAKAERKGYAVYDNTLLKFVSGVVGTKSEANKLKQDGNKDHQLEVREV